MGNAELVKDESPSQDTPITRPMTSKRVLLAEDDREMRRLLAEGLRQDGYDVIESSDGLDLCDCIYEFRTKIGNGRFFDVDLIVSDIRMPWVSGLEVLQELRVTNRETPVILITAFGDEQTHLQAYRLGAVAVLDKPFDLDRFREVVRQYMPP